MENTAHQLDLFKVSEIQLIYKPAGKISNHPKISCSRDAYEVLINQWDLNKLQFIEQFKILPLNRANRVLGIVEISSGGISGTVADPKIIFAACLKSNASSVILSHCHPSGNLQPSDQDIRLTRRLKQAGEFLELPVLDHLIITSEGYFSFADEGLL